MLCRSVALLQGPGMGWAPGSRFSEPNTAIRAPAPPAAVSRRREEEDILQYIEPGPSETRNSTSSGIQRGQEAWWYIPPEKTKKGP